MFTVMNMPNKVKRKMSRCQINFFRVILGRSYPSPPMNGGRADRITPQLIVAVYGLTIVK